MLQRTTLGARENGLVKPLREVGIAAEDESTPGTAQGFMGGGGDDITVRNGAWVNTGSHQTSNVCHVRQEVSTHLISNGSESSEIDDPWVGRIAADDQLGLVLQRQRTDGRHIEALGLPVDAVLDDVEPFATDVDRRSMGQMSTVGQIQAHDRVAGLKQSQEHGEIGLGTAVGLNVGPCRTKQLLGPLNRQCFNGVDVLAAAVVALARQALRVFVGEHRALGLHHRTGRKVLTGNQLEVRLLTLLLLGNELGNGGIRNGQLGIDGCSRRLTHDTGPDLVAIVRNSS